MASTVKTIVAVGVSNGVGFEAIKQLLAAPQAYRIVIGARNTAAARDKFAPVSYDAEAGNSLTVLEAEMSQLASVKSFARGVLQKLGGDGRIDYLFLNAGTSSGSDLAGHNGSKWCEAYIVNHLSQHYLVHLLRDQLEASRARLIFTSSGAIRSVTDTSILGDIMKTGSAPGPYNDYSATKFAALLGAQWWRRQLLGKCDVVAVSPGLIPNTGLFSSLSDPAKLEELKSHPDAKSNAEGGENLLRGFFRDDLPEDPERMFLTSWGEWWEKDVYEKALDKDLQDQFCKSKEEIEKEENVPS